MPLDLLKAQIDGRFLAMRRFELKSKFGVADPVGQGFLPSLAQPGGNITGFGLEERSMGAKWVELLKELAPRVERATILFNPEAAPFARMFLP